MLETNAVAVLTDWHVRPERLQEICLEAIGARVKVFADKR